MNFSVTNNIYVFLHWVCRIVSLLLPLKMVVMTVNAVTAVISSLPPGRACYHFGIWSFSSFSQSLVKGCVTHVFIYYLFFQMCFFFLFPFKFYDSPSTFNTFSHCLGFLHYKGKILSAGLENYILSSSSPVQTFFRDLNMKPVLSHELAQTCLRKGGLV